MTSLYFEVIDSGDDFQFHDDADELNWVLDDEDLDADESSNVSENDDDDSPENRESFQVLFDMMQYSAMVGLVPCGLFEALVEHVYYLSRDERLDMALDLLYPYHHPLHCP